MTNEQKRIYDTLYNVINEYEKYAVMKCCIIFIVKSTIILYCGSLFK